MINPEDDGAATQVTRITQRPCKPHVESLRSNLPQPETLARTSCPSGDIMLPFDALEDITFHSSPSGLTMLSTSTSGFIMGGAQTNSLGLPQVQGRYIRSQALKEGICQVDASVSTGLRFWTTLPRVHRSLQTWPLQNAPCMLGHRTSDWTQVCPMIQVKLKSLLH